MSLNRLITRLAVVSALNNYMREPWPTLAGPNIFDSKIEPVEDMAKDRAFPCCVVYTDYDKDHLNFGSKIHSNRLMTVTLELLIVQAEQVSPGMDGDGQPLPPVYQLDCPMTDSEIETSLDIFEVQIFRALAAQTKAADAFAYLCPSYENVVSRRGASVEGGQRLAARQITLEMKALRDQIRGNIPAEIAAFLDELESFPDYAERVLDIRAAMTQPATLTPAEQVMRGIGIYGALGERLGYQSGPQVMLPANLTFFPTGGLT